MKATCSVVIAAFFALTSSGCRHGSNASETKEFTTIPKSKTPGEAVDYKLSLVPDIPQTLTKYKPKYSREEREDEFFDEDDPEKAYFNITFGPLTKEQFKKYPLHEGWDTPENKEMRNSGLRPFDVVLFSALSPGSCFLQNDLVEVRQENESRLRRKASGPERA